MRKLTYLIVVVVALGLIVAGCFSVVPPVEQNEVDDKAKPEKIECATIQDGTIFDINGDIITTDYDKWGYNYQAHMFNGWYHNVSRKGDNGIPWTKETLEVAGKTNTWLVMKWNDAWLSNKDCDGDGLLDRHYGYVTAIGSGAWETNHQSGSYLGDNGETCEWDYFVKIVAVPEDAYEVTEDGVKYWYTVDGTKIGSVIWSAYARIQQVENDACAGIHGVQYLSPASPGFGNY